MTSRSQNLPARPPGFVYREAKRGILRRSRQFVLHCEDVALPKLAETAWHAAIRVLGGDDSRTL